MKPYPFTTSQIITDAIFVQYGGKTGTSLPADREVSYFLAEMGVSYYIGTLLTETILTGTSVFRGRQTQTDWGHVNSLDSITLISRDGDSSCQFTRTSSCAYINESSYGVIDVRLVGSCGCGTLLPNPFSVEYVYNLGLNSGSAYAPNVLRALVIVAQQDLNELMGFGNESPGDSRIESWSNQSYSEKRKLSVATSLGTSPQAAYAARLLKNMINYKYVGL